MVSELGLAGGLGLEPSPCEFPYLLILKKKKSIMDSDSPRARVWGRVHVREGVEA